MHRYITALIALVTLASCGQHQSRDTTTIAPKGRFAVQLPASFRELTPSELITYKPKRAKSHPQDVTGFYNDSMHIAVVLQSDDTEKSAWNSFDNVPGSMATAAQRRDDYQSEIEKGQFSVGPIPVYFYCHNRKGREFTASTVYAFFTQDRLSSIQFYYHQPIEQRHRIETQILQTLSSN